MKETVEEWERWKLYIRNRILEKGLKKDIRKNGRIKEYRKLERKISSKSNV
jgi:hypothetical protein